MLGERTYGNGIVVEIASAEKASKRLLELLGPGGFRARVERDIVEGEPETLVGRSRAFRVDGTIVWRGQWVADGSTVRWDAGWTEAMERLSAPDR